MTQPSETTQGGFYCMKRGAMDHPLFVGRPFSRYQAYEWMVAQAAWKPTRIHAGRRPIDLGRGQLSHAVRFLADHWRWSKSSVARFLQDLQACGLIAVEIHQPIDLKEKNDEQQPGAKLGQVRAKHGTVSGTLDGTRTGRGQMIITICDYETFQTPWDNARNDFGTDRGTNPEAILGQVCAKSGTDKNTENTGYARMQKIHDSVPIGTDGATPSQLAFFAATTATTVATAGSVVVPFPGAEPDVDPGVDPDVDDDPRVIDPIEQARILFWNAGRALLAEHGMKPRVSGGLLGKLMKAAADDPARAQAVLDTLAAARPVNATSWLMARIHALENAPRKPESYDWRVDPNVRTHL